MFLSSLSLNPRSSLVRRDWHDCHQMHRTMMSAFDDAEGSGRAAFQVLFRRELDSAGLPKVLLQAIEEPDFNRLPGGYLSVGGVVTRSMDPLFDAIKPGAQFRFRITANPTRKIETGRDSGRPNGRRVPLRGEAAMAWLERKSHAHGFSLVDVSLVTGGKQIEAKSFDRFQGTKPLLASKIVVDTVTFEGLLEVSDPVLLKACLEVGLGPGKAYGCGLLSLAPIRSSYDEKSTTTSTIEG